MKNLFKLLISFCLFFVLFINNASSEISKETEENKILFESKCSLCHSTSRPLYTKKTREGWTTTVKRMQSKDPSNINDAEAEKIITYLSDIRGLETLTISKIKDPVNITELEKKHVPVIQIISEDKEKNMITVTVTVGEIQHPMEEQHYIKNIEIFVDNKSAGKVNLKPGDKTEAKFEVSVTDNKKITARANCNVHGIWEGENK